MGRVAAALIAVFLLAGCDEPCDSKRKEWRAVVAALPNRCDGDFDCELVGAISPDSCSFCRISVSRSGVAVNRSEYAASRGPALAASFQRSCGGGIESCHAVWPRVACRGGQCVVTEEMTCDVFFDAAVPRPDAGDASPTDGSLDAGRPD